MALDQGRKTHGLCSDRWLYRFNGCNCDHVLAKKLSDLKGWNLKKTRAYPFVTKKLIFLITKS